LRHLVYPNQNEKDFRKYAGFFFPKIAEIDDLRTERKDRPSSHRKKNRPSSHNKQKSTSFTHKAKNRPSSHRKKNQPASQINKNRVKICKAQEIRFCLVFIFAVLKDQSSVKLDFVWCLFLLF
jgi:hypothetical protein